MEFGDDDGQQRLKSNTNLHTYFNLIFEAKHYMSWGVSNEKPQIFGEAQLDFNGEIQRFCKPKTVAAKQVFDESSYRTVCANTNGTSQDNRK